MNLLPKVGNFWIVLDSESIPKCILKTIKISSYKFSNITKEVAKCEAELTIESWKEAYKNFFEDYLEEWQIDDLENEEVITEFYELVYPL